MEWSQTGVLKLINIYRQFECLWNYRNPDYKFQEKKREAWARLSKILNKDVGALKRKIKHLRTAYCAEKKKFDAAQRSRGDTDQPYEPNLFYFNELRFLDSCIVLRRNDSMYNDSHDISQNAWTDGNIDAKKEEFDEVEICQEECNGEFETESSSAPKKRKFEAVYSSFSPASFTAEKEGDYDDDDDGVDDDEEQATDVVYMPKSKRSKQNKKQVKHVATPNTDDIFTYFTKVLLLQLRQLPKQVATEAMNEIHTLITKKLLKTMSERIEQKIVEDENDS